MSINNRVKGIEKIVDNAYKIINNKADLTPEERRARIDELIVKDMKERKEWYIKQLELI